MGKVFHNGNELFRLSEVTEFLQFPVEDNVKIISKTKKRLKNKALDEDKSEKLCKQIKTLDIQNKLKKNYKISLLQEIVSDLNNFKIRYFVKTPQNKFVEGFLKYPKSAVISNYTNLHLYPHSRLQFSLSKKRTKKYKLPISHFEAGSKVVRSDVDCDPLLRNIFIKHSQRITRQGNYLICSVPIEVTLDVDWDNCYISDENIVALYFKSKGKYAKPEKLKNYNHLIEEVVFIETDHELTENDYKIEFYKEHISIFGIVFKVEHRQQIVLKNIYDYHVTFKRPVGNLVAFKNMKYRGNQISSVLADISRSNRKVPYDIKESFPKFVDEKHPTGYYIYSPPEYWITKPLRK